MIRWDDSSEAEERRVQIFQMVCPGTLEEGMIACSDTDISFSGLLEKKPVNPSISSSELRSLISVGAEKILEVSFSNRELMS